MAVDWNSLHTLPQSEALLNEVKGNLFEYLVAFEMSQKWGLAGQFVRDFNQLAHGKAQNEMRGYQQWLMEHDSHLFSRLPILAKEAANELNEKFSHLNIEAVLLTGKTGAVSGQNDLKECDILLKSGEELHPISLKLCKKSAYVNTKSGGIRSFLVKYFPTFDQVENNQEELNEFLDQSFQRMAQELYDWADISEVHLLQKSGHFSQEWTERDLPELPGQLPDEARQFLFKHYHRMIAKLYAFICAYYDERPQDFLESLAPLLGFSGKDMVQLTLFHQSSHERYQLGGIEYYDWSSLEDDLKKIEFLPLKEGISSFNIGIGSHTLQIRLKPMNKFTVSALKVNCSVKMGSRH